MNDDNALRWVIAAVIAVAIVVLLLYARGPEDQSHSQAWPPAPAVRALA